MNIVRATAEYALLRFVEVFIKSLPFEVALDVGRFIGFLSYHIDRRHRKAGRKNLRMVFGGEKGRAEREAILKALYRHLGMVFVEMLRMERLLRCGDYRKFVRLSGFERIEPLVASGRPIIFVTGHIGNWELLGAVMSILYPPFYTVARRMDNPFIDRLLRKNRSAVGMRVLEKHGSARLLLSILKSGGRIGILVDQNAPVDNIFVDFLGVKASTVRAVPLLALKTGAVIMPGCCYRVGDSCRYVIEAGEAIHPNPNAPREEEVRRIAEAYTRQIEGWVRRHPSQWLWLHRRWKTRPPEEEEDVEGRI